MKISCQKKKREKNSHRPPLFNSFTLQKPGLFSYNRYSCLHLPVLVVVVGRELVSVVATFLLSFQPGIIGRGDAEDKLRTLNTKQEQTQRSVRKPNQRGQMLSLCRKGAVSLSFSWGMHKSRKRIPGQPFAYLVEKFAKRIGP